MEEREALIENLKIIGSAIADSFGKMCEVVVHNDKRSIVFLENGYISGRSVGDEMDATVFDYFMNRYQNEGRIIRRLTKKDNGLMVKGTTVVVCDSLENYAAMLCINFDVTKLNASKEALDSAMNLDKYIDGNENKEPKNIVEYTRTTIAEIIKSVGKPSTIGSKQIRLEVIKSLDEKGVFLIKDSIPQVCELLQISQATLYNYLREIRIENNSSLIPRE